MVAELLLLPMTVDDAGACWELDQKCFATGEAYDLETFHYLLTNPSVVARKIETSQGQMVGFAIGMLEPHAVGHVIAVAVDPQYRRRGLGLHLMIEIEAAFCQRGATIARLEVRTTNRPAQRLYRKLGYVITQRLSHYYLNGEDAYLMTKALGSRSPRGGFRRFFR
jgi:ribosomal-protein-alanine acetyltransferase